MIQDTLKKIEETIKTARVGNDETRQELLKLVNELNSELNGLQLTHADEARNIAQFTQAAAERATQEQTTPGLVRPALDGLTSSVAEFEATHPKLVSLVQSFCTTLSNAGI